MRGRAPLVFAALALAIVAAWAVFPAQAWLDQRQERRELVAQEAALTAENQALQARIDQLGTDEEIERLARQYNLVKPGEEAYFLLPVPGATTVPPPAPVPATEPAPKGRQSLWDRIASIF
ncbi:MAG TPA: septum formation initiator family protein [Acidimicrobiales bacterium]|nr:septum formation initiator family protein [Acidimicrobiales bacterium]